MTKEKQTKSGPLVSQDIPTKVEYSKKPIKIKRPSPKKKHGIVLEDKYARLVRTRKKKEIISTEDFKNYVGKELLLCGKKIYGTIILNEPITLDKGLLKNHNKRHLINQYDTDRLWPKENNFYAYSFRITKMFKNPIEYKNTNLGIIEFKNEIGISKMRDLQNLNREHDDKLKEEREKKEQAAQEEIKEEKETLKSNSSLDKYYNKLNSLLKAVDSCGKYEELATMFLSLYELYLQKGNEKIYDKNGVVLKPAPETPGDYVRVRIRNPKTMVEGSFRTIVISKDKGIKAVVGKLRKDPSGPTKIQSVLFDKKNWDTKRAVAWVKEHKEDLKNLDSDGLKEKKSSPKKVEVKEKIETQKIWICPHCNKEIGEKELYCNEKTNEWFHRPCIEKGPIELPKSEKVLPIAKTSECYDDVGYVDRDKDKGKQEEKWVWCDSCENSFDYYKQLLDDKSTVLCPHCGALVICEDE